MKYCMIETAFDNKEEAEKTIKTLLEKKLVASCQIVESESKCNWKKEYEESKEYLVFMKTKISLQKDIYDAIRKIHSYECFEFAVFNLDSYSEEYLKWIEDETV